MNNIENIVEGFKILKQATTPEKSYDVYYHVDKEYMKKHDKEFHKLGEHMQNLIPFYERKDEFFYRYCRMWYGNSDNKR